jgi:hypothetical protein
MSDTTFNDVLEAEAAGVDWHQLTETEVAEFGLALGVYRELSNVQNARYVAWGTAAGSAISVSVLALACSLCHANTWTVAAIIVSQTVRALWLYLKAHRSIHDSREMEQQAIDVVKELALLHPVKQRA